MFPRCFGSSYSFKSRCQVIIFGGADQDRTDDLLVANEALSQLSYSPNETRHAAVPNGSLGLK